MNSRLDIGATKRSPQVQGVNATAGGLVKATLGAAVVAGAILTFAWLPAEYGIDPTGVGHVLGLTEMGQIKEQLHAEADAEAKAEAEATAAQASANTNANSAAALASPAAEQAVDVAVLNEKLDAIQAQLQAIALSTGVGAPSIAEQTNAEQTMAGETNAGETSTDQTITEQTSAGKTAPEPEANWRDELDYTLTPGQGIEVKLVMDEGAVAEYEWSANGSVLNYDTHANGSGQKISYEQGRAVPGQAGELTAAFTGNHGWFWRNRTDEDVVVTLRTRGDYNGLVLP